MSSSFLFLPVSGTSGAGEYTRSLTIAEGVQQAWPDASIEFVLNRHAGYAGTCPYPSHEIDSSPTFASAAIGDILRSRRPEVVVFDNSGRGEQVRLAKKLGARTVYISSRAATRAKGFGLRRMPWLDQHWIVGPPLISRSLRWHERLRLALVHRTDIVFMDWIFVPPRPGGSGELLERLGVEPGGYVLACAGSGGKPGRDASPVEVFARSAGTIRERTGLPAVVVRGSNYSGPDLDGQGVISVGNLSRQEMVDLVSQARLLITNGGCVFIEGLAARRACVAVALAPDQHPRVRAFSAAGLAVSSLLEVGEIVDKAVRTLTRPAEFEGLSTRLAERPIVNGLSTAMLGLHRLVSA